MHNRNRQAFFNLDVTQRFLRLYMRLVALELTLKDHDPANRRKTHDVIGMVKQLQLPGAAALTPLTIALGSSLSALRCTLKDGTVGPVSPALYPGVRYLRHEADFPGETQDADLDAAFQALEDLWKELQRQGIKP